MNVINLLIKDDRIAQFSRMIGLLPKLINLVLSCLASSLTELVQQPLSTAFTLLITDQFQDFLSCEALEVSDDVIQFSIHTPGDQMHMARHDDIGINFQSLLLLTEGKAFDDDIAVSGTSEHVDPARRCEGEKVWMVCIGFSKF